MIIGIIIILFLLPAVAYLLQLLNVRKYKDAQITLTNKFPPEILETHVAYFAKHHHWSLLHKESSAEKVLYLFQVGSWGVNLRGVQEINLTFFFENDRCKAFLSSKSLMGQMIDFGANQKNIDDLSLFLADLSSDNTSTSGRSTGAFPTKRPVVDYLYWTIVLCFSLLWFIWTAVGWFMPKHFYPGRIKIVFQQRVPDEISQEILTKNGALNCDHSQVGEFPTYECDVPVGDEEKVSSQISRNSAVREASPIPL